MITLDIQIDDRAISDHLRRLQERLGDLGPALNEIGFTLENRIKARFETQTDPDGRRWEAWRPATAKVRQTRGGNILHDTGHMLDSLSYQAGKQDVSIGFSAVNERGEAYAGYHELGTDKMERRGLLTSNPDTGTLSQDDQQTVLEIIQRHLTP